MHKIKPIHRLNVGECCLHEISVMHNVPADQEDYVMQQLVRHQLTILELAVPSTDLVQMAGAKLGQQKFAIERPSSLNYKIPLKMAVEEYLERECHSDND